MDLTRLGQESLENSFPTFGNWKIRNSREPKKDERKRKKFEGGRGSVEEEEIENGVDEQLPWQQWRHPGHAHEDEDEIANDADFEDDGREKAIIRGRK